MIFELLWYSLQSFQLQVIVCSIYLCDMHEKCRIFLANARAHMCLCVAVQMHALTCICNHLDFSVMSLPDPIDAL